ncbi:hypothetical protein O181_038182 [Austropuccinia psidii MF-1]|uniref:Uncharacterized protein n=1 Tax=Austropuccinia psidii MF-1 TaxID=1389203 RepID=A0A9Q3DE96_9BASI|nr:hypothetical protein [Austropuccinia psidii MF-1]
MEENYIPLETQSQANTTVTPSEPEGSKSKGKRHSKGLITAKKWTPISTQRNRKPQNPASIQVKLPKSEENKFVQGTVKETLAYKGTNQSTEKACPGPEDLEEDTLDTVEHKTRVLQRYGSSSSAPPTPQKFISMEHGQQEVQHDIPLGRTWSKFPEDLSQRDRIQRPYGNHQRLESHQEVQTPGGEGKQDKGESSHYPSYRRIADPDRAYSDSFRLKRRRPNQLSSVLTTFRNQHISGQESPFFTIPGSFQEKTRIQGQNLQPEEERVGPNNPESLGFGERGSQEPEEAVNNSRISSPIDRNITPTQIEHNVVTPE